MCGAVPAPHSSVECAGQFRDDLEQVAHKSDISHLEYRRFFILVDRDDRAGVLDAGHVLNRAGDADRNIEVRRDYPPRLADLHLVRYEARVYGSTRRAQAAFRQRTVLHDWRSVKRSYDVVRKPTVGRRDMVVSMLWNAEFRPGV